MWQTRKLLYILAELDETIRHLEIAAFRLISYISRKDRWNSIKDIRVSNLDSDKSNTET